ncbi:bifunctional riboflavin kinase/FAD synthetase [Planctomicrobium piriforme]|uniref:Riboflavin biosynthesis protein n=1 Tax=Planctomicrobium piriforme TaxID=1576369 RepID=A0A1I3NAZ4_9PLAN|nr:bifunctional riboflavin kinase/FAD synthetase [Planctomicrobium piriforme]SFJ06513.1 riboflavin kinase / FMN adenylyltransferase [Planctomicrobium piriforme]
MQRLRGFSDNSPSQPGWLSIGNFDGVHRGHQAIIQTLIAQARRQKVAAVVLTFEPHPAALLHPERLPPRLTTPDQKADLLAELGVDVLIEYPTDWDLLRLTPRQFFDQIVVDRIQATGLVEGPNFYFGQARAGNVTVLDEFCRSTGRSLIVVPPTLLNDEIVSSSLVRQALTKGNIPFANELLNRRYAISGVVSEGAQRGRTLGFPTANLEQIPTLLPAEGVYATWCRLPQGSFPAAVNIGPNPTFAEMRSKVEAHLIGYSGDLYGQKILLEFVARLRDLRPFASVAELQEQITKDVATTKHVCNQAPA